MKPYSKLTTISLVLISSLMASCSEHKTNKSSAAQIITVDLGNDVATLDPQLSEDTQSARLAYDLFEGLTSTDQANNVIPGLAAKWEVTADGKTYTFHLRPGLKFSDGSPLTAADVVYTYQRLANPKLASPYNFLIANLVNGSAIIDGKLPVSQLGIKALSPDTVQINLVHPDSSLLAIAAMPNLAIVPKAKLEQAGNQQWRDPQQMVTSGAYRLTERVVHGHILLNKNPYYYGESQVAINQVKLLPITDTNSSYSQYMAGSLDITYSIPTAQYRGIKAKFPHELYTVPWEMMEFYSFNMNSPKFKNNLKLRQALSMALDRNTLVNSVLGQGQLPLYSYTTSTIEDGQYSNLNYPWATWPRERQISTAQELFKEAGYGPDHPLQITISYNTHEGHKKNVLALTSMWQQVFGADSIQVTTNNQEWKTFIQARHKGDFEIARDGWVADYDNVDSYTTLFLCNNPQNNAKACTPGYDQLIKQAKASHDPSERLKLNQQALQLAMANYAIIPLYQGSYFRLVKPHIGNYQPNTNHFDHVMSKWYQFKH